MNTLNVQRVQLPDGTCVKIEGGDAAATAKLLANNYMGAAFVTAAPPAEEVLPIPAMNFSPQANQSAAQPAPSFVGNVEPLPLPKMSFS